MYDSATYELGQLVQDEISGFKGIVSTVGFHISGCERVGLLYKGDTDEPPATLTDTTFFYPDQLTMINEETKWTDIDQQTEVDFELGERVKNKSTLFSGHVHVINFMIFNCPQALVYEEGGDNEANWIDSPLIKPMGDTIDAVVPQTAQATGAVGVDQKPENLMSSR